MNLDKDANVGWADRHVGEVGTQAIATMADHINRQDPPHKLLSQRGGFPSRNAPDGGNGTLISFHGQSLEITELWAGRTLHNSQIRCAHDAKTVRRIRRTTWLRP
jgi:hypothetical protein